MKGLSKRERERVRDALRERENASNMLLCSYHIHLFIRTHTKLIYIHSNWSLIPFSSNKFKMTTLCTHVHTYSIHSKCKSERPSTLQRKGSSDKFIYFSQHPLGHKKECLCVCQNKTRVLNKLLSKYDNSIIIIIMTAMPFLRAWILWCHIRIWSVCQKPHIGTGLFTI